MVTSRPSDGYQWTQVSGLVKGEPSIGVIQPASNIKDAAAATYDIIVVGASYYGLTAARDAVLTGLNALLLEGRDRIDIGEYPFEMGATWREISRYNMREELEISYDLTKGINEFSIESAEGRRSMSHDKEDILMDSALRKFFNIDGQNGKIAMPFPHSEGHNPDVKTYDKMSVADRVAQIKDELSADENTALLSFILLCSCGTPDNTSFYECLNWWALCNNSYEYCIECLIKYRFRHGQSSFAIRFFEEAVTTNRLSYSFSTPAASIEDSDGRTSNALTVISAVPLNVLNQIKFDPSLADRKQAAAAVGHVNKCVKLHAECRDPELRSWSGITYLNNQLLYAIADGTTPAGNTHIVAFGGQRNHLTPEEDIQKTEKALQTMVPMDIERTVFHNWANDGFAKGAWFFSSPGFITKRLDDLRSRQGNIFFANSDWAVEWRSFIDGAIEEGTRAAFAAKQDIAKRNI
ncbi:monoamine oxidase N [Polychaeton citri CBS 116435]|uniref:Amine oxidase n=1 Tax=Polychaeton citri CBS 116435 TaxID=1314669 RepID=A0A9P4UJZ7_9PEZI|nr:monoamine oxidase N [Polychaeton citri CBS 116435]